MVEAGEGDAMTRVKSGGRHEFLSQQRGCSQTLPPLLSQIETFQKTELELRYSSRGRESWQLPSLMLIWNIAQQSAGVEWALSRLRAEPFSCSVGSGEVRAARCSHVLPVPPHLCMHRFPIPDRYFAPIIC